MFECKYEEDHLELCQEQVWEGKEEHEGTFKVYNEV